MLEVAAESILADVLDDGVPGDASAARERFESILLSCDLTPTDEDEDEDGGDANDAGELTEGGTFDVYAELRDVILRAMTNEEDEEDYLSHDQCEMCERVTPLTRHHLFPRSQVKHFEKRGFCPLGRSLDEVRLTQWPAGPRTLE